IVETAIALAVAAIPEGLPIVATIALARGMARMARRNALVEKLEAVETLGSVEVILTDKTGTLTENRMTVDRVRLSDRAVGISGGYGVIGQVEADEGPVDLDTSPALRRLLEVAVLCNNADIGSNGDPVGDPMEVAMLMAATKAGLDRSRLLAEKPRVREEAFDPDLKMMATAHRSGDSFLVAAKGAPLEVIQRCSEVAEGPETVPLDEETMRWWLEQNERMAAEGLRVIALADGNVDSADADPFRSLRLLGLIGLIDPPRRDILDSIEAARRAGVRVVMVTGDQEPTAVHVATSVGLDVDRVVNGREIPQLDLMSESQRENVRRASILARTSPSQKLDIIELHQQSGSTVAMIGDGVNDAPALKRADIGVAMGERGTEVAKEASDMILRDDSFGSIVAAIEQGRVIFRNIRVFVLYLLSCNLSEVLAVGVASAFAVPLPILPLQILYLNLVTDVFPALALGAGEGSSDVLRQRPRDRSEPILTGSHWRLIIFYGALITASVMAGLLIATHVLDLSDERAVTISYLTLGFAQLWHVFNMVGRSESSIQNEVTRNRWVWAAIGLGTTLLVFPLVVPALSDILSISRLSAGEWLLVAGLSLVPLIVGRLFHTRLGVE
ncbi:MAG: cation-transporting P-type ATPase, partial [Acidimicrobiia bacterium]